jgi:hypothetical protein
MLASGSEDGTVRLWIAQAELLADLVGRMVGPSLTREQWTQFVGDEIKYESFNAER